MKGPPAAQIAAIDVEFTLDLGGSLPSVSIAYETWGELNEERSNCILVVPAFSANCHARSSDLDPSPGWWEHFIGPGLAIDIERFFVVCPSLLAGCHGTTGPLSTNPTATNKNYEGGFPLVTIGDIARCHLLLLDALNIETAYAICGGSMGAMQSLEIGLHHGRRVQRVVAISGTDRTRPATAAIRHLGRRAILLDPAFKNGFYGANGPEGGLRLAREVGTVFYRSKKEFNDRFAWQPIATPSLSETTFDVQSYLAHQGAKMVGRFDANSYLRLSLAMDLHDLSRQGTECSPVIPKFYIGGVEEDRLMPIDEQIALHEALLASGAASHMAKFSSPVGHDAFLVKHDKIGQFIGDALGKQEAP